ncbi:DNA-binding transcriptional regulator [Enterobacter sp. FY-07]|nr:DNA-binding transcriptional regulator [Enterobacter sp. FY-07]
MIPGKPGSISRIRCVSAERCASALISLMAYLTQLFMVRFRLSFCAQSSESRRKKGCLLAFDIDSKEKFFLPEWDMLDKVDRKLLSLLQQDCSLSLQALADAVNLTTTPCWKRLKRLEDDGILLGRVAVLDAEKLGLNLTAFVLIKTQHHSSEWYCRFVSEVTQMPEVLGFWRMAGEYDYLLRVQVADMKRYDDFYKKLVNSVPGLSDVTSSFAMEQIKYTTALPIE